MVGNWRVNLIGGYIIYMSNIVCRIFLPKCTCDYVKMCGTDSKFIVDVSCCNVIDSLNI